MKTRLIPSLVPMLLAPLSLALAWPVPKIPREMIPADMPKEIRRHVEVLYDCAPDQNVCGEAIKALGDMGSSASCAAPFLASMLDRKCANPDQAADALVKIGPASVEPVLVAMRTADLYAPRRVAAILSQLRDPRCVPAVVAAIADGLTVMEQVLRAIGQPSLDYLLKGVTDESVETRRSAVLALPALASTNVVGVLAGAVGDRDDKVRLFAMQSLVRICDDKRGPRVRVPTAEAMFDALRSPDAEARRLAVMVLRRTEGEWGRKLEAFASLVGDSSQDVQREAIDAIGSFNEPGVVAALLQAGDSPDPLARAGMAEALGRTGRAEAVEPLRKMLKDGSALVRGKAVSALVGLGTTNVPALLLEVLGTEVDALVRKDALTAIGKAAPRKVPEDLVKRLLADPDKAVCLEAVEFVMNTKPGMPELLLPVLGNKDPVVRAGVIRKLSGNNDERVTAAMTSLLADPDSEVRRVAMEGLGNHGRKLTDIAAIRKALDDRDWAVRRGAVALLASRCDAESRQAFRDAVVSHDCNTARSALKALAALNDVAGVRAGLSHLEPEVRSAAVLLLARMDHPDARKAIEEIRNSPDPQAQRRLGAAMQRVPAPANATPEVFVMSLRRAFNEPDGRVRDALVKMGAAAVKPLLGLLGDPSPGLRAAAVDILGRIRDAGAVEGLAGMLRDPDAAVRESAVAALGQIGGDAAVSSLAGALDSGDARVREAALRTLVKLGAPRVEALLASRMKDPDWHVRWVAADGLGRLKAREGVGALVEGLSDPHWYVRGAAAGALGAVGDRTAVPKLVAAVQDQHWYARRSARESLASLTGRAYGDDDAKWREWLKNEGLQ